PSAAIVAAVAHHRPTVVLARADDVELVAAVGAVLALPNVAGDRVHGEAERAPVAERIDRRVPALLPRERIVLGHAAVVVEAQDLAGRRHVILSVAAARCDVELAVLAEDDRRGAAGGVVGLPDLLDIGDARARPLHPRNRHALPFA